LLDPLSRDLSRDDVDAVPSVDPADRERERLELLLVVMPGGLLPDILEDGVS
jgi:hypothetical protein